MVINYSNCCSISYIKISGVLSSWQIVLQPIKLNLLDHSGVDNETTLEENDQIPNLQKPYTRYPQINITLGHASTIKLHFSLRFHSLE